MSDIDRAPREDTYRAWLSLARRQRRLTQKQAADRIGVSLSTYQKYEYGIRTPSVETAENINRVFGVNAPERAWRRAKMRP